MQVKHKFASAKGDGGDSTLVRPSNWNADHDVLAAADGVVLGRAPGAGPGAITEIAFSALLPIGLVLPYAGASAPAGWLLCTGLGNRTTHAALFAVIGTTYGVGDGATTFGLPEMRGVVPAGKSNMGGSDRGNLPGGTVLGAQLGVASNQASINVAVSGSFTGGTAGSLTVNVTGTTDGPNNPAANVGGGGQDVASNTHGHDFVGNGATSGSLFCSGSITGNAVGSSASFSIVQPTIVLNYIINTGV
jgi:microcystin-dependent protein